MRSLNKMFVDIGAKRKNPERTERGNFLSARRLGRIVDVDHDRALKEDWKRFCKK